CLGGEVALEAGGADHRQGGKDRCPLTCPPAVSPSTEAHRCGQRSCPSISPAWGRKRKRRCSTRCGPGGSPPVPRPSASKLTSPVIGGRATLLASPPARRPCIWDWSRSVWGRATRGARRPSPSPPP